MGTCESCGVVVKKQGHHLCYKCWKSQNSSSQSKVAAAWLEASGKSADASSYLTATKIGENFGLSGQKMNLLLNELGWTYKPRHGKGWSPTKQGKKQGASPRTASSGVPYLVWPEKILSSRVLKRAVSDFKGESEVKEAAKDKKTDYDDFRKKYPANYRCMDGHYVRSRAEVMIDNWLYTNGFAHAYERKLPIEQDVYSDFYIKQGNVYIEFWGMESDEKYSARKKVKQKAYSDNDFNLIELNDNDLENLDDILPGKLLKYGLRTN